MFSDVGVPAALFIEDYDNSRQGYHDTHDNMENIDLDHGAAVTAIAIATSACLRSRSAVWSKRVHRGFGVIVAGVGVGLPVSLAHLALSRLTGLAALAADVERVCDLSIQG